jgi:hypothetical protein
MTCRVVRGKGQDGVEIMRKVMRKVMRTVAGIAIGVALAIGSVIVGLARPVTGTTSPDRQAHTPGWRVVKVFTGGCGAFDSMTATGPKDAWATGTWYTPPCEQSGGSVELLVARWNGSTWQRLQPPNIGVGAAVAALSTSYAWIFANPGSFPSLGSRALLWDNGRWKVFRLLKTTTTIVSAAVFSRSNAWVFGTAGPNELAAAFRFNGRAWHQVPVPLWPIAAAAPSARNIWVVGTARPGHHGTRMLAHWTGRWRTIPFPKLKVPTGYSNKFVPQAILWDDKNGAWVSGRVFHDNGSPGSLGLLLHWTGKRWVPITTEGFDLVPMAHDGDGGLWTGELGEVFDSLATDIRHYSASGVWSAADTHEKGLIVGALRLIPGTTSVWAGGAGTVIDPDTRSRPAVILKYGP